VNAVCPGYVNTPMTDVTIDQVMARSGMTRDAAMEAMLGTLSLSTVAENTTDSTDGVTVVEGLVYALDQADDGAEQKLDLYLGAEGVDAPLVVHVPGRGQLRSFATELASALAEQGTTVLVVDGPDPSPEAAIKENARGLREMVESVACAVRFARGSEYGSETAPLVLSGYSHGGGAASHVALAGEDFASLWEQYSESAGGLPAQYDCTVSDASTRVDGFVGIAGSYDAFVGYEGKYGREFMLEHDPDLWEVLYGTIGMHPELPVRLLHADPDSIIPYENSVGFEAVLAEAGYDVELTKFDGGHIVPLDLTVRSVMELLHT
jgi:dienelactone hydrolase